MNKDSAIQIDHTYDPDADAIFIHKIDKYKYDGSVELNNDIIMDFDTEGKVAALEILNASKVLKVSKHSLKHIGPIQMETDVDETLISLKLYIGVIVHNKELIKSLNHSAINDINAPTMDMELATA